MDISGKGKIPTIEYNLTTRTVINYCTIYLRFSVYIEHIVSGACSIRHRSTIT